jgi:hypothetical protein
VNRLANALCIDHPDLVALRIQRQRYLPGRSRD